MNKDQIWIFKAKIKAMKENQIISDLLSMLEQINWALCRNNTMHMTVIEKNQSLIRFVCSEMEGRVFCSLKWFFDLFIVASECISIDYRCDDSGWKWGCMGCGHGARDRM